MAIKNSLAKILPKYSEINLLPRTASSSFEGYTSNFYLSFVTGANSGVVGIFSIYEKNKVKSLKQRLQSFSLKNSTSENLDLISFWPIYTKILTFEKNTPKEEIRRNLEGELVKKFPQEENPDYSMIGPIHLYHLLDPIINTYQIKMNEDSKKKAKPNLRLLKGGNR